MPTDAVAQTEYQIDSARVQALSDWLIEQGLRGATLDDVLAGFCEGFLDLGILLWRGQIAMRTLHPSLEALTYRWLREEGVVREEIERSDGPTEDWQASPFSHLLDNDLFELRQRLTGPEAKVEFGLLERFRSQGATDYVARIMPFGDSTQAGRPAGVLTSWTTDR